MKSEIQIVKEEIDKIEQIVEALRQVKEYVWNSVNTEINIITEIKDTDNKKDPHSNSEVTNLTPVTCKKLPMKCNIKKMYTFKSKHLF